MRGSINIHKVEESLLSLRGLTTAPIETKVFQKRAQAEATNSAFHKRERAMDTGIKSRYDTAVFRFIEQDDKGFSLIETMVAMLIFAMVSAAGVALLSSFQKSQNGLQAADDLTAELQMVHSLIRADMEAAVLRPARNVLGGQSPAVFEGGRALEGEQVLKFVRGGHLGALVSEVAPAVQRVDYLFDEGRLIRRSYARPDATEETPVMEQVLLKNIEALRITFGVADTWTDEWGKRQGTETSLPEIISLEMDIAGKGTLRSVFVVGVGA